MMKRAALAKAYAEKIANLGTLTPTETFLRDYV